MLSLLKKIEANICMKFRLSDPPVEHQQMEKKSIRRRKNTPPPPVCVFDGCGHVLRYRSALSVQPLHQFCSFGHPWRQRHPWRQPPLPLPALLLEQVRLLGMICLLLAVRKWQLVRRAALRAMRPRSLYGSTPP